MSQIENGIRAILATPTIYNLFQTLMGAKRARKHFADNFLKLTNGQKLLDIGCGTAAILDYIPEDTEYYGFDLSETYIEHAKKKFSRRGSFTCAKADSISLRALPKVDVVLVGGLFHHLNDDEVNEVMRTAKEALLPSGRLVAIDPCYDENQNSIAKWLIDRDRGENVRKQDEYAKLANKVFDAVESTVVQRVWIPYTHNILVCK